MQAKSTKEEFNGGSYKSIFSSHVAIVCGDSKNNSTILLQLLKLQNSQ